MVVKERLTKASAGAPGLALIGAQAVAGLLLLYAGSFPGTAPLWTPPVLLVFLALGAVWLVRLVIVLSRRGHRPGVGRNPLRWAAPPLIGILVLAFPGQVGRSRFALSEESFQRVARSAMQGGPDWRTGRATLGSFDVAWAERHGETVRFALAGGGDGTHEHGLIWSPRGEPPLPEDEGHEPDVEHFRGPWYLWSENF
ncbi:hypothetical protein AB0D67_16815 [Streptosporangium sp. NPDC048047]|uniref:hypothetical protein n=1 Tax=Streptosporangium sp. NPDC048047 TaxID=3155748 RepID=UPI00341EF84C